MAKHFSVDRREVVGRVHRTVAATHELAVPVVQCEEELLVVTRRILSWLDQQESMLSGVLALFQIGSRKGMSVVPAKAGRSRCEGVARSRSWRDHRRSFFHRAVDV